MELQDWMVAPHGVDLTLENACYVAMRMFWMEIRG